jgi:cytochrome d ubiquinol oxidase subunit II
MSNETLGIIMFFMIGLTWTIYLAQEIFISGVSMLNTAISKNEKERKQLQVISGLHFDGMEVWLIATITMTYGVFPLAFGTIFTYLYVVMFLLVFTLIGRGVSVEVIYKLDDKRWQKAMTYMWLISSVLLVFLLGVYMTNIFYGFPIGVNGLEGTWFSVLNLPGILGGLLFVSLSLVAGAGWIKLKTIGDIADRGLVFVKKYFVIFIVPVVLLLTLMGINNTDASIYGGELFTKYPILFTLPGLAVLAAIMIIYYGMKLKGRQLFIHAIAVMVLYLATGFIGSFPNVLASNIDVANSITILDTMSGTKALQVVLLACVIFFPIIIGYQTWKYIKFSQKVKLNDEE